MKRAAVTALLLAALGACSSKPAHYYVLCDETDYNGWKLITAYKDENGYIMSCTYQSQDQQQTYTVSCRSTGCD